MSGGTGRGGGGGAAPGAGPKRLLVGETGFGPWPAIERGCAPPDRVERPRHYREVTVARPKRPPRAPCPPPRSLDPPRTVTPHWRRSCRVRARNRSASRRGRPRRAAARAGERMPVFSPTLA